jgi:HAD superfamily hydrolase (TIGR01549 family)
MARAILFDLGDTLIDFQPMDMRAIFRSAARQTYDFLLARGCKPPPFVAYCRVLFRKVRWAYFWAKVRRRDFNSLDILRRYCDSIDAGLSEQELLELAWIWYSPLVQHSSVEEGLVETLAGLRQRGYKFGLISNTFVDGATHDRHLAMVGLLEFFPVRIYSSAVGYRKPQRRIFMDALEQLEVEAGDAFFVGDLVKNDIVGARRVGMTTVLKQPWGNSRSGRLADFVIRRISEIEILLAKGEARPSGTPLNDVGELLISADPAH